MKNHQDGGEAILEAIRNLGVEYVISSPGSEWPSFWEALAHQKRDGIQGPTYLDCGHETLAVTIASAYTKVTGRMQTVLLHAGAGLLQGALAINAARAMEVPMLVMSGESLGYGESDFDPGSQWYRSLGIVGGSQRLMEPLVKWAQQVPAPETLYESVVRAGEMAQRLPKGPTYLCVSMETMLHEWRQPAAFRKAPLAPKTQPLSEDIERVAHLIAQAKFPVISVDNGEPSSGVFDALVELAELMAIPVVETQGALFGNFPKSHDLYLGANIEPFLDRMDLALLVESRTPWYPPSRIPNGAEIVAIGENPLKGHMVYQVLHAGHYLEGSTAITLRRLCETLRALEIDPEIVQQRRAYWAEEHRKRVERLRAAESEAKTADTITVPLVIDVLQELALSQIACVDETIVHAASIREHLHWDDPFTYFRAPSGLGQGLGYALGVKLALPERLLVMTIGDGTFMYNPVIPALAFADEHQLPMLIIVFNNAKYAAMQFFHDRFYPQGTSVTSKDYYGVNIKGPRYQEAARLVEGFASEVTKPEDLKPAMQDALAAVKNGKSAILNVIMPGDGQLR